MKAYFSRHAKRRMKWRKISEDDVLTTINTPDNVGDSINGRKNAFKHIGEKWIKVTYIEESERINIITVIDKK